MEIEFNVYISRYTKTTNRRARRCSWNIQLRVARFRLKFTSVFRIKQLFYRNNPTLLTTATATIDRKSCEICIYRNGGGGVVPKTSPVRLILSVARLAPGRLTGTSSRNCFGLGRNRLRAERAFLRPLRKCET